ncbi:MAG: PBSX family phage terminase large subunit [Oscillospiraceae bacterium]|nr:PBSX family phage terminase large subunit [Oscillospiraceae bacterium]
MNWWHRRSPHAGRDALVCDGAVRSGKTLSMCVGFFGWLSHEFDGQAFAICGKTMTSLRRNIVSPMLPTLRGLGFDCEEKISKNYLDIKFGHRQNRVYLFGGKDEGSAALIQGMTLAGVLFDEVALMPRSFVEQAIARCSVTGSRLWFNCNPEYPQHWFYREWVLKAQEKNTLHMHFTMDDNPSLDPAIRNRYKVLYSGAFYKRFVEGIWAGSEGVVYPMFEPGTHVIHEQPNCGKHVISCDYGTVNPSSFGLWGEADDGTWVRLAEYYWDSRANAMQRTDEEHYRALEQLAGERQISYVVCDPSAASFIECIRRHGRFTVIAGKNDVVSGIRQVADALREDKLKFHASCKDCIREFGAYTWESGGGRDAPRKEHDHAMDDVRYFVATEFGLRGGEDGFFAGAIKR